MIDYYMVIKVILGLVMVRRKLFYTILVEAN